MREAARRRLARGWHVLRTTGLRAFAIRAANRLRLMAGLPSAGQRLWLRRKAAIDRAFDDGAGVDTGGIRHLYDLTVVGPNAGHGVSHIAIDPGEFAAALADLPDGLADATFVDLGSGKGRALLLAAAHPFARIVGVEFAAELHGVAEANLAARADRARFTLVHGDAAAFDLPDGPVVLFLFNPFGAPVMAQVAVRAMASWRAGRRPIAVLYVNPLHADAWIAAGWRAAKRGPAHSVFVPA